MSLSWASLKMPATSTMERLFRAGIVNLKERNTADRLELTSLLRMQRGFEWVSGWWSKNGIEAIKSRFQSCSDRKHPVNIAISRFQLSYQ